MKLLTDHINGPHVILEDLWPASDATLMIRQFHAGAGKVALKLRDGRKEVWLTVSAAELIEAVKALVPEVVK